MAMRAVVEYRKHAEECRKLAQQMIQPADKRAFEVMAQNWEILAELRRLKTEPEESLSD